MFLQIRKLQLITKHQLDAGEKGKTCKDNLGRKKKAWRRKLKKNLPKTVLSVRSRRKKKGTTQRKITKGYNL